MQPRAKIKVWEFEWDDNNMEHCAVHGVTPTVAESVKGELPSFFENRPGKTGTHVMIGPDHTGAFWTVILLTTALEGRWRPITGWPSERDEVELYNRSR